jgi:DNA-binding MarR family transcriptional regulator
MNEQEIMQRCFANRLRAASRAISRHYDAALAPLDLRISQLSVLVGVGAGDGERTIVEIAEYLAMDRSTLSRNFDPLVRRGLIELGPETRHRARRATLTPAGQAMLEAAYPLWQKAQADIEAAAPDAASATARLAPIVRHFG